MDLRFVFGTKDEQIEKLLKTVSKDCELIDELTSELMLLRSIQVKPVQKYLTSSIKEQWKHVHEEFEEALIEIIKYDNKNSKENKLKLLDELNDMQISIETLKTIVEPDENKRNESMIKTINKNMVRGYYDK